LIALAIVLAPASSRDITAYHTGTVPCPSSHTATGCCHPREGCQVDEAVAGHGIPWGVRDMFGSPSGHWCAVQYPGITVCVTISGRQMMPRVLVSKRYCWPILVSRQKGSFCCPACCVLGPV